MSIVATDLGSPATARLSGPAVRGLLARQFLLALRFLIAMTLVLGVGYPLLVWGIGQAVARPQADGSLVSSHGQVVGSSLIGQDFTGEQWFQSRPSAAGQGYDPTASGGSNLAAGGDALDQLIAQRRAAVAAREHVAPDQVPPDALTASASGLDPDISPAYAAIQIPRVAAARHLPVAQVTRLVAEHTSGPWLGLLGVDRVNVLELNLALRALPGQ